MAPETSQPQGCGEIWLLTRIALGIILPFLAILVLAIVILISAFYLLVAFGSPSPFGEAAKALVALVLSGGGIWYLVRRLQRL